MAGDGGDAMSRDGQGDAATLHRGLVRRLAEGGLLPDPQVEAAFRAVPRHIFLPGVPLETVYSDEAIPTKQRDGLTISSSSQPAVMATMLDQLGLRPGDRVLEIGAGTGYNAALMAHIVGETGQVITLDIDEDIVADARAHLAESGFSGVLAVRRDGAEGYQDAAPYDRIIATVGAWDIAPAWVEQLRPNGRLVLPLTIRGTVQKLVAFERVGDHLASVSVRDGVFMPLRGAYAGPQTQVPLGPVPGLVLGPGSPHAIDAESLYTLLTGPHRDVPVPFRVHTGELWAGFSLWLALYAPRMCSLAAFGDAANRDIVPSVLAASPMFRATMGLLDDTTICLLARSPDVAGSDDREPLALSIRSFGPDDEPAQRLIDHLSAWEASGRPSSAGLRIRAYPRNATYIPSTSEVVVAKEQTRLVLDWP